MARRQRNDRDEFLTKGGSMTPLYITEEDCTDDVYEVGEDECNIQTAVPASGSITFRLPSLGNEELIGRDYHFLTVSDGGGTGVEVEDRDDAILSGLNYATASNGMTAAGDNVILRYCGTHYRQIAATLT